jgi:endonuclease/exonuclease/phosphatase family metal-dependent hydrolase
MLRVTTFNLRTGDMPDGANQWDLRKHLVADVIRAADPDVLGAQEALANQYDFLDEQFGEAYDLVGVCRDDGCRAGEANPLLIRRNRFDVIAFDTFWLSESPENVGGKGWDAHYPRICTWAKVRDRETGGVEMLLLNTHLDHAGVVARHESAGQIRRFIAVHAREMPFVLIGDFNCGPETETHRAFVSPGVEGIRMVDAYRAIHPTPSPDEATWHAFAGERRGVSIDWILCSAHFSVAACEIDRSNRDGRYPSDHFPVTAELHVV